MTATPPAILPTIPPTALPPRLIATRLALLFFTSFVVVGVVLPYWPVYLQDRGLGPEAIGWLLALQFWIKVPGHPAIAWLVERSGSLRSPTILLSLAAAAAYLLFDVVEGLVAMAVVAVLFGLTASPLVLLGDSLTLRAIAAYRPVRRLDYGRLRLWGSIGFIAALLAVGEIIETEPPSRVLWVIVGALAATAVVAAMLPDLRPARSAGAGALPALLRQRPMLLLLLATGLINGSHGVYYGFSAIHWRAAGMDGLTIGLLWAEGVVAEILLFAAGGGVAARLGAARLLVLAGLGGVVRWTVLAGTTDVTTLAAVQWLHGLTFGAMHLASMRFLAAAVPTEIMASAQSLHASIPMGMAIGLASLWAGALYADVGGAGFLAMAGLAGLGAVAAAWLGRAWDGDRLPIG